MEKVTRDQVVTYLDTTPSSTYTWSLLGVGVTSYGIAYNPQITTEKWIINKNATSSLDSFQMQGDVSQKIYKGDPCFEYINELRRELGVGSKVETHVLDIDTYDEVEGEYKATLADCIVTVTNYMAEEAVIEYSIYYNGDPVTGTVDMSGSAPVFTADTDQASV